MKKTRSAAGLVLPCALLAGCTAIGTASTVLKVANVALEASGLKQPELPESQKPPRKVVVSLAAGKNLNADAQGKPLAVVARIYKLRDSTSFYQAPFDAFVTPGRDKALLGDDLIETREITLLPNQQYDWTETVPRHAGALAVVVLFHSPGTGRWRFAFDPVESEKSGVLIGAHACALTVTRGAIAPVQNASSSTPATPPNLLTPVPCRVG
jgi:type VI secretion system protein VasD